MTSTGSRAPSHSQSTSRNPSITTTTTTTSTGTATTTTSPHPPPPRPPTRTPTLELASAIDSFHSFQHNPQIAPFRKSDNGSVRKQRGHRTDQSRSSRFSLIAVAEKTTKAITDLTLRERASQPQLKHQPSSSTVTDISATSGARSPRPRDSVSSTTTEEGRRLVGGQISDSAGEESVADGTSLRELASASTPASTSNRSGKMHQTSSRLLRMTDDDRPFTRDFKDLFSTLMVSLPLTTHRVRFQRIDHSFTSEEAINNLGSLKFSQSNRMPDPKDPSRIVTTTTTTTFSMAKEMARAVCQRFLEARFIEAADGKAITTFPLKGPVWQLTPKGIMVLQRFCQRNGIQQRHVLDLIESPRNTMTLVILERDATSDRLSHDSGTISVIFRRFAGVTGPNIRSVSPGSDGEPAADEYYNGLVGVRQQKERRVGEKVVKNTFTGKQACDWLMDCTTIIDRRETYELADEFVKQGLMEAVVEDKIFIQSNPAAARFQPTRSALYHITLKGKQIAGWDKTQDLARQAAAQEPTKGANSGHSASATNNNRLLAIVQEPSLRLLFREYLINTHCEENLSFYLEVSEFTQSYDQAERAKAFTRNDAIRESLAAAYGLYNAFLAPGSPNELNIDHNLRNGLAGRMTRAVGDDESMLRSLQEVVALFKDAQNSVFKLMSSDSVPKFLKDPKFTPVLKEYNFDLLVGQTSSARRSESPPDRTLR